MKYLFVHQNYPAQYQHIVRHLVSRSDSDVVFLSEPNANFIPGVRVIPYPKPAPPTSSDVHVAARELDSAARRADVVARTASNLKQLGFQPDIIIGHHGWGELLNLPEVWPGVPMLGYFEFYYATHGTDVGFDPEFPASPDDYPRIRAKNAVNDIALNLGAHGQTPTKWQRSTYPAWAQPMLNLLPEGVDLDVCAANPRMRRRSLAVGKMTIKPGDKLVTYVARDLEPYRGFHSMMRALPHLLKARKDIRVVMVGGDGISYGVPPSTGTWREKMLAELGDSFDASRVSMPGRVDYKTYLSLLQRSDAHVYLSYPFVASWSLREALAAGCAIVGSDTPTVTEFLTHESNGLLTSFFDPKDVADAVLRVLEDTALADRLRANARAYAEKHLAMTTYIAAYMELIDRIVAG